jgi:CubicO group peptidase (beta-lactamase class C family)
MLYSNNDYVVAGYMLEVAAGKPWEELISERVFEPLGIHDFGFGPPGHGSQIDQPLGHRSGLDGPDPVSTDVPDAMGPAGRVHMSLSSLLSYLEAHRDKPGGFLTNSSWDKLHNPPFGGNYALGWVVSKDGTLTHGGTNGWWKAEVMVAPGSGTVCGATANILNRNTESALLQLIQSSEVS